MAKAVLKTVRTKESVTSFVNSQDPQIKKDCKLIIKMMRAATISKPTMWGNALIGFGNVHLTYPSGRELDWFKIGFSPRKKQLSLYVLSSDPKMDTLLEKLGSHKRGKGCLYLQTLDTINIEVLNKIIVLASKTNQESCS